MTDPDGNHVELYCDRPRADQARDTQPVGAAESLDLETLRAAASQPAGDVGSADCPHR